MGNKFLRLCCPRCKRCHIVYGRASLNVKCEACKYLLIQARGGKAKIRAPVKEVLC